MDIPINADVHCVDGLCGRSTYVILKPATRQVTHLVVREHRFPHTEHLVPVDWIVETTPARIRLRCTAQEVLETEPFIEAEYVPFDIPSYSAGAPLWPYRVALGGGLLLIGGAVSCRQFDWRRLVGEVSWPIFPFVGGLFVLVRGVENLHFTQAFGAFLLGLGGQSSLGALLATTMGAALGANLVNNVPMALVMVSAIRQQPALPTPIHTGAIYATILGSDLGPNLTTIGSLATMLWVLILRRKGLEISTREYLKLGLTVVPFMLVGGALLIWLQL